MNCIVLLNVKSMHVICGIDLKNIARYVDLKYLILMVRTITIVVKHVENLIKLKNVLNVAMSLYQILLLKSIVRVNVPKTLKKTKRYIHVWNAEKVLQEENEAKTNVCSVVVSALLNINIKNLFRNMARKYILCLLTVEGYTES